MITVSLIRPRCVPLFVHILISLATLSCSSGGAGTQDEQIRSEAINPDKPRAETDLSPSAGFPDATLRDCKRRCLDVCARETHNRRDFYESKRGQIEDTPFSLEVEHIFLTGECHQGNDPSRRPDADGISAVVEGKIAYTGDDVLYRADLSGAMLLLIGMDRLVDIPVSDRQAKIRSSARFPRRVRGSDPWFKGGTRAFHWESSPADPVFCEVVPERAEGYIELETTGVDGGRKSFAIGFVPLVWEEVLGMSLKQQVRVKTGRRAGDEEPADAHYSKLSRILVTRLTGKTQWIKRTSIVHSEGLIRGPAAVFPTRENSPEWKVAVTGISHADEFGGYAPSGEDQSLFVVDAKITYTPLKNDIGAPLMGNLDQFSLRLETSPDKWQKPTSKALGQLDVSGTIQPGGSISGSLVFVRQRFERPFRLEVITPDKTTLYLDVFGYEFGLQRSRQ